MASEQDPERQANGSAAPDIAQRLDAIDGSLLDHIENDERLQSGVPAGQRPTDLDFIQMSGLARPATPHHSPFDEATHATEEPDLDVSKPLSFFEKGIADVDGAMTPQIADPLEADHADFEPETSDEINPDTYSNVSANMTSEGRTEPILPESRISRPPDLEEAEQLLQALESQPREIPAPGKEPPASPMPPTIAAAASREEFMSATEARASAETVVSSSMPTITPTHAAQQQPQTILGASGNNLHRETIAPHAGRYDYPLAIDQDPSKTDDLKDEDLEERDASVYTKPMPGKHTRRSKGKNSTSHTWRRLIRNVAKVTVVAVVVGGLLFASKFYHRQTQPSSQAFELARQIKDQGNFKNASDAFKQFAQSHPDDPLKAEAEFQAAYCMQQAALLTTPFDEQQALKTAALDLYKQFVTDNPAHEKMTRAKVILGLLAVDLGRYQEGIELLQTPDLLLADPDAALPALRALATARLKVGNRDAAASAYLQAITLSRNYTPEADLDALATIYSDQANEAKTEEDRKRLLKQAVDRLNEAFRLPTVDPGVRNTFQTKRDYILKELGEPIPENEGKTIATPPQSTPPQATQSTATDTANAKNTVPGTPNVSSEKKAVVPPQNNVGSPATSIGSNTTPPPVATPDPHMEIQYPSTAKE